MTLFHPSSSRGHPRHYCGSGTNQNRHVEPVVQPPGKGRYLPPPGGDSHIERRPPSTRIVGNVNGEDLEIVGGSGLQPRDQVTFSNCAVYGSAGGCQELSVLIDSVASHSEVIRSSTPAQRGG